MARRNTPVTPETQVTEVPVNTEVQLPVASEIPAKRTRKKRESKSFDKRLLNLAENLNAFLKKKSISGSNAESFKSDLHSAASLLEGAASLFALGHESVKIAGASGANLKQALAELTVGQLVLVGGHKAEVVSVSKKGRGDQVVVKLQANGMEMAFSKSQVRPA